MTHTGHPHLSRGRRGHQLFRLAGDLVPHLPRFVPSLTHDRKDEEALWAKGGGLFSRDSLANNRIKPSLDKIQIRLITNHYSPLNQIKCEIA